MFDKITRAGPTVVRAANAYKAFRKALKTLNRCTRPCIKMRREFKELRAGYDEYKKCEKVGFEWFSVELFRSHPQQYGSEFYFFRD